MFATRDLTRRGVYAVSTTVLDDPTEHKVGRALGAAAFAP